MPKRAHHGAKGRRHHGGGGTDHGQIVQFYGRYTYSTSAASALQAIPLNPLYLDARVVSASDLFQEYRFKKVTVRAWAANGKSTFAIAYSPTLPTNAPTALLDLAGFDLYRAGNGEFGSPAPRLTVSSGELSSNGPKWFRRGTAYDDLLETQGSIYIAGYSLFSVVAALIEVDYHVELKAQSEASLTIRNSLSDPEERKLADIATALSMVKGPENEAEEDGVLVPGAARPPVDTAALRAAAPSLKPVAQAPRVLSRRF